MLTIEKEFSLIYMLLNISAILMPPKVVILTTLNIVLEFQAANGSATHIQVEYAKEETASVLDFKSGSHVTVSGGKSMYQVSQEMLQPGTTYHIRVVPLVRIYSGSRELFYRGIPSDTINVTTPAPGRVCIMHSLLLSTQYVGS